MPLKYLRTHYNAVSIFAVAILAVSVGLFFIFNLYLSSVSQELVESWLQSEAVNIQEGNLLSSISKNQRVLLSSQFVKGVVLFDMMSTPPKPLIEVGEQIGRPIIGPEFQKMGAVSVIGNGLFKKQVLYRPKNKPSLVLIFNMESTFLNQFFYGTVGAFILFVIVLFASIRSVQNKEFKNREKYLKEALSAFIELDKPSELVKNELPFLVEWWKKKKTENEIARRLALENEGKIFLGELAARVAHDIRSPLGTLSSVADKFDNPPPNAKSLLKEATQRIRDIAVGLENRRVQISEKGPTLAGVSVVEDSIEPTLLFPILEVIVSEKRAQAENEKFDISLDIAPSAYRVFAKINALELKRTLSNLIDNSLDALVVGGGVKISLAAQTDSISIVIQDNGKGIPAEILNRIGEKRFTHGKLEGTGQGIYYAKAAISSWQGKFEIKSDVGLGTTISIHLPMATPPQWFANELVLTKGSTVIILDDDPTVHATWQLHLESISEYIRPQHFFDSESVISWFLENKGTIGKYCLLSDYDLGENSKNGLDVIERFEVSTPDGILVTSSYEDLGVRARCTSLNIKMLPKPALPYISVTLA